MYKVLIVEDDPMVAMIDRQFVARTPNFEVCGTCGDGESALEFLTKNSDVDLIILDQYMPKMKGTEVFKEIRNRGIEVSVIMVTAANDSKTIEEVFKLGVSDYLVKPFTVERFTQALVTFEKRQTALSKGSTFDQRALDAMMLAADSNDSCDLPKGINQPTVQRIQEILRENISNKEMTSDELADIIGVSRVTIRRYMNYFMEKGLVSGRMNYDTGGRPAMFYMWCS